MSESDVTPDGRPDLVVIGGGITGCAVARDAAARGLSVVLVEKTDLAVGTSGKSTKLLHGGLRYLEQGHLRLVREALREREITARLAPALARPLPFCLPIRPGTFPGRWAAQLGVRIYDALAGDSPLERGHAIPARELRRLAPGLSGEWTAGVTFVDRQTDDAALTVALARDAVRRGARIRLGLRVIGLARHTGGLRVSCRDEDDRPWTLETSCAVNASGPWSDVTRALWGRTSPILRVSRGAHLVLEVPRLETALILPGTRRQQRLFAIPWRGATLFGTTDVADTGDPGRDLPEIDDLRELFQAARALFPGTALTRASVLSSFTGVRPLLSQEGDTLKSSREHRVLMEDDLVTIAGGKLTTWRTMAIDAVDVVVRRLGRKDRSPESLIEEPLPGGDEAEPSLESALTHGMARHAEDIVFRRLPIGHDPRAVRAMLPAIVEGMAARLGWSSARRDLETSRVLARLDADCARLDDALSGV